MIVRDDLKLHVATFSTISKGIYRSLSTLDSGDTDVPEKKWELRFYSVVAREEEVWVLFDKLCQLAGWSTCWKEQPQIKYLHTNLNAVHICLENIICLHLNNDFCCLVFMLYLWYGYSWLQSTSDGRFPFSPTESDSQSRRRWHVVTLTLQATCPHRR